MPFLDEQLRDTDQNANDATMLKRISIIQHLFLLHVPTSLIAS